jgi:hypothetical protein
MIGIEARANLVSSGWMQANPELAEKWRRYLQERQAETASDNAAREANDSRAIELDEALADLEKWALRARMFGQVASEAYERAMQAYKRAERAEADPMELARRLGGPSAGDLPALPLTRTDHRGPGRGGSRAVGGAFFFYGESGFDADGDGDVDGGLVDYITGGGANDDEGLSGFLGDLLGG